MIDTSIVLPDGVYELVVEEAQVKKTHAGRPFITVWLLIDSGTFKGTRVAHKVLTGSQNYRQQISTILTDIVETCGLLTVSLDLIALLMFDRRIVGKVKTEIYQGKYYRRLVI